MKKHIILLLYLIFIFTSCENSMPGYRFSNFKDSPAKKLAVAVKHNNNKEIRNEVLINKVDVNSRDRKYKVPLLSLAIANDKKEAFMELLKLGANPNAEDSDCVSPLILAIKTTNYNCDLFYIKTLISYGADLKPGFFNKCNFSYDPLLETILDFNDEDNIDCGIEIIKLISKKLNNIDLNEFNNPKDYYQNIVYFCLKTRNISALKFFIVDMKAKVPKNIYINGTVLTDYEGYISLRKILQNKTFTFKYSKYREDAKREILKFINSSSK